MKRAEPPRPPWLCHFPRRVIEACMLMPVLAPSVAIILAEDAAGIVARDSGSNAWAWPFPARGSRPGTDPERKPRCIVGGTGGAGWAHGLARLAAWAGASKGMGTSAAGCNGRRPIGGGRETCLFGNRSLPMP